MSKEFRNAAWELHLDKKYQGEASNRAADQHKLLRAAKINQKTFEGRHPHMLNHRPFPVRARLNEHISDAGYSGDADPHSGHVDPSVDFGLKKLLCDKITVFF